VGLFLARDFAATTATVATATTSAATATATTAATATWAPGFMQDHDPPHDWLL
jgi:hypothetical protein